MTVGCFEEKHLKVPSQVRGSNVRPADNLQAVLGSCMFSAPFGMKETQSGSVPACPVGTKGHYRCRKVAESIAPGQGMCT